MMPVNPSKGLGVLSGISTICYSVPTKKVRLKFVMPKISCLVHIVVIMLDCLSGHRGSIPLQGAKYAGITQLVEYQTFNLRVQGSSPCARTKFI